MRLSACGSTDQTTNSSALGRVSPRAQHQLRIDWLRMIGPVGDRDEVVGMLDEVHGDREESTGRFGFTDRGVRWASGASVHWKDDAEPHQKNCMLELSGKVCAALDPDEIMLMVNRLAERGWHCTRIDVAVDFITCGWSVVDEVRHSCEMLQLCGARCWQAHRQFGAKNRLIGNGMSLGSRGSGGSGRYVRVYDKGLEQGNNQIGQWERWEVEFTHACANDVAVRLASAMREGADWRDNAWSIAFGSVDFRVENGRRELARRARVTWFAKLVDGVDLVRVVAKREAARLANFGGWVGRSVMPTIRQIAARSGQAWADVITELVGAGSLVNGDDRRVRPCVWEYFNHEHQRAPVRVFNSNARFCPA
jgi:hypothetical protein